MPLTKEQKQEIIEDLKEKIKKQKLIIFVDFRGLKTKDLFVLREKLKTANAELKVVKKTLLGIAFKEIKTTIKELKCQFALILGFQDAIPIAKIIYEFSKENEKLKILGGFFENQIREKEEIIELAKIPSREELLTKLVDIVSSPLSKFTYVIKGNIRSLIVVLTKLRQI